MGKRDRKGTKNKFRAAQIMMRGNKGNPKYKIENPQIPKIIIKKSQVTISPVFNFESPARLFMLYPKSQVPHKPSAPLMMIIYQVNFMK